MRLAMSLPSDRNTGLPIVLQGNKRVFPRDALVVLLQGPLQHLTYMGTYVILRLYLSKGVGSPGM